MNQLFFLADQSFVSGGEEDRERCHDAAEHGSVQQDEERLWCKVFHDISSSGANWFEVSFLKIDLNTFK